MVNGTTKTTNVLTNDPSITKWCGLLLKNGILVVLITKTINIWHVYDTKNHEVWKTDSWACMRKYTIKKVKKSKNDPIGPKNSILFLIKYISKRFGVRINSSSTLSAGIVVCERS